MTDLNYDDPAVEERWRLDRRPEVEAYLQKQSPG